MVPLSAKKWTPSCAIGEPPIGSLLANPSTPQSASAPVIQTSAFKHRLLTTRLGAVIARRSTKNKRNAFYSCPNRRNGHKKQSPANLAFILTLYEIYAKQPNHQN